MREIGRKASALFTKTGLDFKHFGFKNLGVFTSLFLFALTVISCTNIDTLNRSPSSTVSLANPIGGSGSSAFHLIGLVTDPVQGSSVYDLLGQDNEFDQYCNGTYGVCSCKFSYQKNGGTQVVEVANTYQESNMIRCSNIIPPGVSSFEVKIITGAGPNGETYESNSMIGSFGPSGTLQGATDFVDLQSELSYAQVKRYQCRKSDFIASPFDSTFLDPIQSQDPRVIYAFNYYTSNVGESLLAMQRNATSSGWDCTLTPTLDYRTHWWANPLVFSAATCTSPFCIGDGELMYPPDTLENGKIPVSLGSSANGKRRSSFALLSKPYNVFNVPVIAATAPQSTVSAFYSMQKIDNALTLGPLGYAARAIPALGGSSACPSVPIPSNAHWVKLWSFRATDLIAPRKVTGSMAALNSPIACFTKPGDGIFDSCTYSVSTSGGPALASLYLSNNPALSARVALTSGLTDGSRDPSACYKIDIPNYDQFIPSWYAFTDSSNDVNIILNNLRAKPWGLYSSYAGSATPRSSPALNPSPYELTSAPTTGVPTDMLGQNDSQPMAADPYTDHLFVVTEVGVNDSAMISMGNGGSSAMDYYRPVTYRSKAACSGYSLNTCNVSGYEGTQVQWGINTRDVNNPNGAEVYPLCVLQFTD